MDLELLEGDDTAGVCELFPLAATRSTCDPEPLHGFTTVCNPPDNDSGCSCIVAGAGKGVSKSQWEWCLVLGLWLVGARRNAPVSYTSDCMPSLAGPT